MDFISSLASQFGIDEDAAKAIAGTALGSVQSAVKDEDDDAAAELGSAVPELGDWKSKAASVLDQDDDDGGGGGLLGGLLGGGGGDLLGAVAGAVGGSQAKELATLVQLLGKLGIDPSKAAMVAPMALNFLKDRLSPETLSMAMKAAPFLLGGGDDDKGGDDDGGGGGIGDLVGGLFK